MNLHLTEAAAAKFRNGITRRGAILGVATAAIIGVALGIARRAATLGITRRAATLGITRRTATLGVATAAIIGVALGPTVASSPATPIAKSAFTNTAVQATAPAAAPAAPAATATAPAPVPVPATAQVRPLVKAPIKPPVKPAAKAPHVAVPTTKALLPHGIPGHQAAFKANATQKRNVAAIVKAGKDMKLPPRAMVAAVACSLQESTLHNYGNLGSHNDHDSLGLFQQRPSSGWGSPAQVTNPHHATQSFLKRLVKIHNWQGMPLTIAVQKVQVSAFPHAYAKWERFAASLVAGAYAADAAQAAAHAAHAAGALPAPGK